jgi:hypothetical protein
MREQKRASKRAKIDEKKVRCIYELVGHATVSFARFTLVDFKLSIDCRLCMRPLHAKP